MIMMMKRADLVHLSEMLTERKEVGDATAEDGGKSGYDCIPEVGYTVTSIGDDDLEDETGERLPDVVERERGIVVVELETQDLLGMGVDGGVLEAPEEAHQVGDINAVTWQSNKYDRDNAHNRN